MPRKILSKYIPEAAIAYLLELIAHDKLYIKITAERKTKHGDYRALPNGLHQITINGSLNKYRFLVTLVHEIAHFEVHQQYGRTIKPHGLEWKVQFQKLMLPLLNPKVFPPDILSVLARHLKNPKATSDTDLQLSIALKKHDPDFGEKTYVFQVPFGKRFKIYNGRQFKMGKKRTKRYECEELSTGRLFMFNPNAEVELLD